MNHPHSRGRLTALILLLLSAICLGSCASEPDPTESQTRFPTAEAAFEALVAALRANEMATLEAMLGPSATDVLSSGDEIADANGRREFVALYDQGHSIETDEVVGTILHVGTVDWPMPIPVVKDERGFYFDCEEGCEEILDRRVGRNELSTLQTCLAYIDAQEDYFLEDRDGDGLLEYAQNFLSRDGERDGLYWATAEGEEPSPLGAFAAEASREGYDPADADRDNPRPYHGYYFRILTSQGPNAPGGAYDYLAHGSMIGGCAMICHPATHGVSGVMSFMVSHDGKIFQQDLGEDTEALAEKITSFDPGEGWTLVEEPQQ